jgi:hypothetical protein
MGDMIIMILGILYKLCYCPRVLLLEVFFFFFFFSLIQCHTSYGGYANYDNWNLFKLGLFSSLIENIPSRIQKAVLTWNLKRRDVP